MTDETTRIERLELLATRIRAKYGRCVLRSCGLDDIQGRGIVLADCEPGEFEGGKVLLPARRSVSDVPCDNPDGTKRLRDGAFGVFEEDYNFQTHQYEVPE